MKHYASILERADTAPMEIAQSRPVILMIQRQTCHLSFKRNIVCILIGFVSLLRNESQIWRVSILLLPPRQLSDNFAALGNKPSDFQYMMEILYNSTAYFKWSKGKVEPDA